jgi:hypothetical protein
MKKAEIQISEDAHEEFERMAKKAKLSPEKLMSILLEAFIHHDGKVFTGRWAEGPGLRLMPDWPRFSSGIIKIKESEMTERSLS